MSEIGDNSTQNKEIEMVGLDNRNTKNIIHNINVMSYYLSSKLNYLATILWRKNHELRSVKIFSVIIFFASLKNDENLILADKYYN